MKDLSELKNWLERICESNLENEKLDFVWEIMKSPYVEFHYDLLNDKTLDDHFKRDLASRFNEHGEKAENLLFSKLDKNEDVDFHGNIIFLLGKIKSKNKTKVLAYARKLAEDENDFTRERAIIVLGWVGAMGDTKMIAQHLLQDKNAKCRAWSASSFMQMWFKNESVLIKKKAFVAYKKALPYENDYLVLSIILSSIRTIGKTKLGISQTALDKLDIEKIEIAKIKAMKFLDKTLIKSMKSDTLI
ncbi:MAG: HEAT repeat domain-containing protein [Methylophilaceae bacterium]